MAAQAKRVNDESPEAEINRLMQQIEYLKRENRTLKESADYWHQLADNHQPAAPVKQSWVVTSDYCKSHNVSPTYLNRALNGKEGYSLSIPGRRSATGRWLVNTAAEFTHRKKSKPSE